MISGEFVNMSELCKEYSGYKLCQSLGFSDSWIDLAYRQFAYLEADTVKIIQKLYEIEDSEHVLGNLFFPVIGLRDLQILSYWLSDAQGCLIRRFSACTRIPHRDRNYERAPFI